MTSEPIPFQSRPFIHCRYGASPLAFRGPKRPSTGRFIACLGGGETYAKFVQKPYCDLLETVLNIPCLNLSCPHAGPDVFLKDPAICALVSTAELTIVQTPSPVNLSNKFYKVHPRRNDRFTAPCKALRKLYPEIDFFEVNFCGHLIQLLSKIDPKRFRVIVAELHATWLNRMSELITLSSGPVLLLHLVKLNAAGQKITEGTEAIPPTFYEYLAGRGAQILTVQAPVGQMEQKHVPPHEGPFAAEMFGPAAHRKIATLAAPLIASALKTPGAAYKACS